MRRCLLFLIISLPVFAARPITGRYALLLADTPIGARAFSTQAERATHQQRIETAQATLKTELTARSITVTGSVETLLNAVFVQATKDREAELRSLPGVTSVVPLKRYRPKLDAAIQLVNAPAAWPALGGVQNAGAGIKIAILDTGIDQNHPSFQDSSLKTPAGYPL